MDEMLKRKFYREKAVEKGTNAIAEVINGFEFIVKQLKENKERFKQLATLEAEAQAGGTHEHITRLTYDMGIILARVAQVASSQHNSHVDAIVRAMGCLASSGGEDILF